MHVWALGLSCEAPAHFNSPALQTPQNSTKDPQESEERKKIVEGGRTLDGALVCWEVPTCANLNLYGGSGSRVRWHSDNEGLFGKQGSPNSVVSMSFGVSALFKWKPGPGLDSDAGSSWLHHGDLFGFGCLLSG